ncbi:TPA: hypothetical protein ACTYBD_004827 [Enterobacter hormaechei]|uniref:hypothetical protein n=1 Tax=Enterobacteriaceae TaxID=543 RepID=UPI00075C3DBE|nr:MULTISPECIES: hypothetical protein [Enterobacteriaceae]EBH2782869.1 hypothetical protein [Salmonella enterica]ECJ4481693.1 hypothetical protein [Salmonella enterica subsp. diarizonae]EIT3802041.1 hypothetical protein [Escherichia coli]HBQ3008873.1 hypothetical protein [Klebsiella quasipneumoniae subsp. similipneumoniae]HCD2099724.1 hypothetical protein [Klebsiella pneumoniae]
MTLVVAGFEKDGSIVFCGDSLITTKSQGMSVKLTSSFRKIMPLEIIVRVPDFDTSGKIVRYFETESWHRCMIAFAGSTLVSQHIINSIQGHLRQIKYTYDKGEYDYHSGTQKGAGYKLIMGCEDNNEVENTLWDDDVFIDCREAANNLLSSEFLVSLVKHCIEKIITEFYLNTDEKFEKEWFASDFIVALSCYKTGKNHLFTFKMEFDDNSVKLVTREIGANELAIIGITRYNNEIHHTYQVNQSSLSTESILFKEVVKAVEDNESADLREIGKPIVFKKFDKHRELRDKQKEYRG